MIAYASKGLSKSQRNYCTTYRELFAVVEFITHFKHFLMGRRFVVRSDHSSLRWLLNFKDAEGLVGRWLAKLANYDFEIEHRAGVNHGNADAMSRNPALKRHKCCGRPDCEECSNTSITGKHCSRENPPQCAPVAHIHTVTEQNWAEVWSPEELRERQQEDNAIRTVYAWVAAGSGKPSRGIINRHSKEVRELCGLWPTLLIENGLLCRRWSTSTNQSTKQLLAPPSIRAEIFQQLHSNRTGGHLGRKRTVHKVRTRFFWPRVKTDVTN